MEQKAIICGNKGMVRDISISNASNEYAYENYNIRITAKNDETLLSITNERGNKPINVVQDNVNITINGLVLGYAVLNSYLILFTTYHSFDFIYILKYKDEQFIVQQLIKSTNLKFDANHPIETLTYYESEDVQKVYWVDGINQPRFLNIKQKYTDESGNLIKPTIFDFVTTFVTDFKFNIEKIFDTESYFTDGTIQYVFTYSNKFGQETNVVATTPLYYLSNENKGVAVGGRSNCVFNLKLTYLDKNFDYLNIYSIVKSSNYAAYKVASISLEGKKSFDEVTYIDNGNYSESIDPTILYYMGGKAIHASTINQKDNTLFLGNIELENSAVLDLSEFNNKVRTETGESLIVRFIAYDTIDYYEPIGFYSYKNQLNYNSNQIKNFKGGNTYRFAVRFKNNRGEYSSCYWIGDKKNPIYPKILNNKIRRARVNCQLPKDLVDKVLSYGYTQAELMVAESSVNDRTVIAQGIVNPTLFNLEQRYNNSVYSIPSWYTRCRNSKIANSQFEGIHSNADDTGEIQCINDEVLPYFTLESIDKYKVTHKFRIWLEKNGIGAKRASVEDYSYYSDAPETAIITIKSTSYMYKVSILANDTYSIIKRFGYADMLPTKEELEIVFKKAISDKKYGKSNIIYPKYGSSEFAEEVCADLSADAAIRYVDKYKNNYFVDESIVTLNSPDITVDSVNDIDNTKLKFRIVGIARITSNISDYIIDIENPYSTNSAVSTLNFSNKNISTNIDGLVSFPLYQDICSVDVDSILSSNITGIYKIYPWHKTGSIIGYKDDNGTIYSKLKSKIFANLKYSYDTYYLWTSGWTPKNGIDNIRIHSVDNVALQSINVNDTKVNYQGNYDNILTCRVTSEIDEGYPIYLDRNHSLTDKENLVNVTDKQVINNVDKFYDPTRIRYYSTPHAVFSFNSSVKNNTVELITLPKIAYYKNNILTVDDNFEDISNYIIPWDSNTELFSSKFYVLPSSYDFTKDEIVIPFSNFTLQESDNKVYFKTKQTAGTLDILDKHFIPTNKSRVIVTTEESGANKAYKLYSDVSIEKTVIPFLSDSQVSIDSNYNVVNVGIKSKLPNFTIHTKNDDFKVNSLTYKVKLKAFNSNNGNIICELSGDITIKSEDSFYFYNFSLGNYSEQLNENTQIDITAALQDSYLIPNDEEFKNYKLSTWFDLTTHTKDKDIAICNWPSTIVLIPLDNVTPFNSTVTYKYLVQECTNNITFIDSLSSEIGYYNYYYDANTFVNASSPKYSINSDITTFPKVTGDIDTEGSDAWLTKQPYVFIGELYNDEKELYGGIEETAISNNKFIPCSDGLVDLTQSRILYGTEGDTYFQRYDCVKTLPLNKGDENSVIDICSVMLETYTNIDGRYDNRRGLQNIASTTKENFNLINFNYTQNNSFFGSTVLDSKFKLSKFPNQITWTKTKTPTSDVDTWTNITLASLLDLDGDKGEVQSIRRFNNSLIVFQDRGISEILFNSRTQLSTTQGVPIEIANSGKVDGKRYISEKVGCLNKWSITETPKGIYFIDNLNTSINRLGQGIESLSDAKGFKTWLADNNSTSKWNPIDFSNFITFYDRANDDIYFVNKFNALCYNEMLEEFTSFYDYNKVPMMVNVEDKFISFYKNNETGNSNLWIQGEGEYNNIFGEYKDFYSIYKVNPSPYTDKIFTNIEYRADFFDTSNTLLSNETFNRMEVYNEYQTTEMFYPTLNKFDRYPDIRNKFRTWRVDIPRAAKNSYNKYGLDRIRSPWIYFEMRKTTNTDYKNAKAILHNVLVKYYE